MKKFLTIVVIFIYIFLMTPIGADDSTASSENTSAQKGTIKGVTFKKYVKVPSIDRHLSLEEYAEIKRSRPAPAWWGKEEPTIKEVPELVDIDSELLINNLRPTLENLDMALSELEKYVSNYEISEVHANFLVTAEGEVGIIISGSVGASAGITIVFKKY